MADIDLSSYIEDESPSLGWLPIGNSAYSSDSFQGVLDGNGKTIFGLIIKRPETKYVGLFGKSWRATFKNLRLIGNIQGKENVGLLTGYCESTTIINCSFDGKVQGVSNVGGCVGAAVEGDWQDISSTAAVEGTENTGGIFGNRSNGTLKNSYVYSNINGSEKTGGVGGSSDYTEFFNCRFIGSISASKYVGGLCGYAKGVINNCSAIGQIRGTGNCVGGLAGYSYNGSNSGICLKDNYFSGSVSGKEKTGGLVGYKHYGVVENCYSMGSVSGTKSVGGLFGTITGITSANAVCRSNVVMCVSVKATVGNVGRVFGESSFTQMGVMGTAEENKAYNRTIVIDAGVAQDVVDGKQHGTGVSATTLKLKATYVAMGWDFTDTWDIQETECYPYFKTQTAPPVITSQVISGATTVSGKCVDGGTITLEIDGVKQQMVSTGNTFSFTVSPLQAGHEVRVSAKAEGKEQSYYTTEVVSFLGKGTEADPYQISTAADLTQVYRKGYYKLMNDIDLTSYINQFSPTEGWQSIGRDGSETIHFDGYGHKITGLWCNSTRDNTGLFSCFANGEIKNLTVETAKNKQVKGGANTGIIIGKMMNGTIENCVASGSVADGTPVGGIVGLMDDGTISKCQANVTINTAGAKTYVGGIVGEITGGKIDQCFTQGTLTATGSESYAAGLVGKNSATVADCYTNTTITSSHNAAGVVAYNYGVVEKCYATGNLFSSNYAAGIIGYNDGANAVVKNCAAMNNKIDVTYESQQQQQGGGYGQRIIGGIKNGAPAPELNNYALKSMQVSVNNVAQKVYDDIMNGAGKNGSDLLKTSTYQELGWDFTNTWNIKEGENYPLLKNNSGTVVKPGEDPTPEPDPDSSTKVDVTDITALTDAIYVNALTTLKGGSAVLTVCLKNAQPTNAYSFDLLLPERVSLAEDNEGNYLYELSSRHNGHSETVNDNATKGVYSFAVLSLQSKEVKGNDGAIWKLHLKIDDDMPVGDYAVKIQNAKYSTTSGSAKVSMPETISILTIEDHKKGDVNGDGDVDIADAVCIVNNVVGKTTPKYIAIAADVNGDGDVDIADAVRIVNLVVGKIGALAPQFVFGLLDPQ